MSRLPFFGLFLWLLASLSAPAQTPGLTAPPGKGPVVVGVGFYLLNLNSLDEKTETFEADIYLDFEWKDERLAFAGTEPQMFVEDGAVDRLKEIWWPHIEFVNTATPQITNRVLTIAPDGTVSYMLGLTATFRTDLDLRRFPFDHQKLIVRLESFMWTVDRVVFRARKDMMGFEKSNTFEGLRVLDVQTKIDASTLPGWDRQFSEFLAIIEVKRNFIFYLWTVFTPVILTFLITATLFFVPPDAFSDRISVSLTGLLACIATQFAISFGLPQIDYLTIIDRLFVVTYACIALSVLLSVLQVRMMEVAPERCLRLNRWARGVIPLLYLGLLTIAYLL